MSKLASGSFCAAAAAAAIVVSFGVERECAAQEAFFGYGAPYRTIVMPPHGAGSSGIAGAALPDGRILAVTGLNVMRETAVASGVFETVAVLDAGAMGGTTDPAFVRISPDGGRIAVGGGFGRPLAVFSTGALGAAGAPAALSTGVASYFDVPHYDAAWADGSRLALTAGEFGSPAFVSLLDVMSPVGAPDNRTVVTNIRGASAGIAFDGVGRLYTGNGFAMGDGGGGSATGTIRAFDASILAPGSTPADFESGGWLIGDVLSASGLAFDLEGNLMVGGGDFSASDFGYLGVISGSALAAAIGGAGPIDPSDPLQLRRLTPAADPFAFYSSAYNPATGEVYARLTDFASGTTTWYATVPGAGTAALLPIAGVLAGRRRRA